MTIIDRIRGEIDLKNLAFEIGSVITQIHIETIAAIQKQDQVKLKQILTELIDVHNNIKGG